jgi:hypothetical protein
MVTVSVRFDLTFENLIAVAVSRCWNLSAGYEGIEQVDITKTALDDAVRAYLHLDGSDRLNYEWERLGEDAEEAFAWASAQVTRLYPEFA